MSRPKGSLNKRTRAALSAAAEGKLGKNADKTIDYLARIANDPKREDSVRMQAANILLPYCKPRLASVEQTNIDERDKLDPAELQGRLIALFGANPDLLIRVVAMACEAMPDLVQRVVDVCARYLPPNQTQRDSDTVLQSQAALH